MIATKHQTTFSIELLIKIRQANRGFFIECSGLVSVEIKLHETGCLRNIIAWIQGRRARRHLSNLVAKHLSGCPR